MKMLIIEDEPKTAQALCAYFEEDHQAQVDCAFDGFSGKAAALKGHYDIILTDIVLPGMDGIDLCRHLRGAGIRTPILILSALYQPEDKVAGLNAGADDYLSKPFHFKELVARIQALVRRAPQMGAPQSRLFFEDLHIDLGTLEVLRADQKITLTPREFSLLEYFVRNPNRVIPKLEILENVWGLNEGVNTNVVEVYVNYVRNKVDKGFAKKLLHTHFGVGYILKSGN
jgi:two-component system copper resistance phosphate regulon response regulator CusR